MIPAAGGDQQRYSVGLVAEGFEGPVESGRLVRPRTTAPQAGSHRWELSCGSYELGWGKLQFVTLGLTPT
jgi:hypothetical protein